MTFRNRTHAGEQLAEAIRAMVLEHPIILALPRGGVPVGFEVAKALAAPLDILFVRKIGAPHHPELGLGAVVDGAQAQTVLNESVVKLVDPPKDYVEKEAGRQLAEIERRRKLYLGGRKPLNVTGRTVVLVDDGIATGGTVRAALQGLSRSHPARLILAVPVAPSDTLEPLRSEADAVICLETPDPFYAVGYHYVDFRQTSDQEVIDLLNKAQEFSKEITQ